MIAVTFALESESSDFIRLLQHPRKDVRRHTVTGALGHHAISVLHSGVGEIATRARIDGFLTAQTPRLLISSGFAGALDDSLDPGALFLAENFSSTDLHAAAKTSLPFAAVGKLQTINSIVDSTSARADLARTHGAGAVDMETEFITAACAARDIPMLSLRVISDTPQRPFPAPPSVLFDVERQRTDLARVGFYIATHPAKLGRFVAFARQIARARAALARGLHTLLSNGLI